VDRDVSRGHPHRARRYHVGGAWLACKTATPVVPVAHNAGTLWGRNAFIKYPGTISVSVGPAIDPQGLTPEQLNQQVEDWIETEVARLGSARNS
jgi:1-acyl-sn-glycerol-3-phosphate acyltransferase